MTRIRPLSILCAAAILCWTGGARAAAQSAAAAAPASAPASVSRAPVERATPPIPPAAAIPPPALTESLQIKYVRDSEEYATLVRQVYRAAGAAVARSTASLSRGTWAVVLDVDETALDNSAYQLERAAYRLPFDSASWGAWVLRAAAQAIPGAPEFVGRVRGLGGRVVWITNRSDAERDATRANLKSVGLWNDDDLLCTKSSSSDKAPRRAELASGTGRCAWPGRPMPAVAYLGDQLGDFPAAGEPLPDAGSDEAFGRQFFLLPNPMYGPWTGPVTRRARP